MRFLIDAHLPRRAVEWFRTAGFDAIHTLDLPRGNRTTDPEIIEFADQQSRVVITKDADFVDTHTLCGQPRKLLLISTGNITNAELERLLTPLIVQIVEALQHHSLIELGRSGLAVRD